MEDRFVAGIGSVAGNMNVTGRRLYLTVTFNNRSVAINKQKAVWRHFRPVPAIGIDQIEFIGSVTLYGKVIADALMHIEISSEPDCCSKIIPILSNGFQMVRFGQHGSGS